MVSSFHTALGLVLALLIASPLCCCAVEAPMEGRASCCAAPEPADGIPDQAPHVCACHSKDPKELSKDLELPGAVTVPMPQESGELTHLSPPEPVEVPRAWARRSGCDPPKRRLARWSRWLI